MKHLELSVLEAQRAELVIENKSLVERGGKAGMAIHHANVACEEMANASTDSSPA